MGGMDARVNQGQKDNKQKIKYNIELPIPQQINDSNAVSWGEDTMNIMEMAALTVAQQAVTGGLAGAADKFESAAAKKTKMYNSEADDAQWYTFQIMSGANAQNLWRVQIAENLAALDDVDTEGNAYWEKTVGDLHESGAVRRWGKANPASYTPELSELKPLTRALFFNFDPTKAPAKTANSPTPGT